jgi:hypothetical protein
LADGAVYAISRESAIVKKPRSRTLVCCFPCVPVYAPGTNLVRRMRRMRHKICRLRIGRLRGLLHEWNIGRDTALISPELVAETRGQQAILDPHPNLRPHNENGRCQQQHP